MAWQPELQPGLYAKIGWQDAVAGRPSGGPMTVPDDKRKNSPADRFRSIMSAEQARERESTSRTYPKGTSAPVINLPRPNSGEPSGERHTELAITPVLAAPPPQRGTGL